MNSIAYYRKQCGYSQRDVAVKLGITQQSYQKYEKGKINIGAKTLTALSKLFDVSIDNLLGETPEDIGVAAEQEEEKDAGRCVIPFYNSGRQSVIDTYEVSRELWGLYGDSLYAQRATGNSMSPLISEGDVLIFARNLAWNNGDILSVSIDGLHFVKKVYQYEKGVELCPSNPLFDVQFIAQDKLDVYGFAVVGKLVQVIKSFC